MKGSAIDLTARSIIFIAVITLVAIAWFAGVFGTLTSSQTCTQDTISQINTWVEKMSEPAAGSFKDQLRLGDCVEYLDEFGIKFRDSDEKKRFKNIAGVFVVFETDTEKVLPSEDQYNVTVKPPSTIKVYRGE